MSNCPVPRYWFPQAESIGLDEAGFLLDPEHEYLGHRNSSAAQLCALRAVPCLVLLGEAGLGKSTDLRAEQEAVAATGEPVIPVDLGEVGSDEALVRYVFTDPAWERRQPGRSLTLYLDALDECRVSLPNAARVLLRELRRLGQTEWLKLRIACRSGSWPRLLDEGLKALWPEAVGVYQLAPLRRKDAETIATAGGLPDPGHFLAAVLQADAGPLASVPLTLKLLTRLYRQDDALPARRRDVYEQGCLELCTEYSLSRRATGTDRYLSASQRVAVASRLAVLTILCGRAGFWLGPDSSRPARDWLSLSEATGGSEEAAGLPFDVTEARVREVLEDTGLFAFAGTDQLRWAHRSYADFLAARYLRARDIPAPQLRNLLWHPANPGRVVPQLMGVVAWLGSRKDILASVGAGDPQILCSMDLDEADDTDRTGAVAALLRGAADGRINEYDLGPSQYRRLVHTDLSDQLCSVIGNKNQARQTRELALDIGKACCLDRVQDALVSLALDRDDTLLLRCLAASTVSRLEDPATRSRLLPLLESDLREDVQDDLRGYALRATWPHALDAERLFRCLTPLKQGNYLGPYWRFLREKLVPGLREEDLPVALRWMANLGQHRPCRTPFREVCDAILLKAWDAASFEVLTVDLARAIWARIQRHERAFGGDKSGSGAVPFAPHPSKRRLLLSALLPLVPGGRSNACLLFTFQPRLLLEEDIPWLIAQLDTSTDPQSRDVLTEILMDLLYAGNILHWSLYLEAAERHPDLHARLSPFLTPVALCSPEADQLRQRYEDAQTWQRERSEPEDYQVTPPPRERILLLLDRIEAGQYDLWCDLTQELTLTPTSRHYGSLLPSALVELPGWQEADEPTRDRLRAAAELFLLNCSSCQEEWFHSGCLLNPLALAGFKAFRLLLEEVRACFDGLESSVWERWLPALFTYPAAGDEGSVRCQGHLLAFAYRKCPEAFLEWFRRCILRDNERLTAAVQALAGDREFERREAFSIEVIQQVEQFWDGPIAAVLRGLLADRRLHGTAYLNLLECLLRNRDESALELALASLNQELPAEGIERQRFRGTATVLLEYEPAAVLPVLEGLERADPCFCRRILLGLEDRFARAAEVINARLSERQLAHFYRVVVTLFPREEIPSTTGFHPEPPSWRMRQFASHLLRYLCERGMPEAVAALDEISPSLPEGELRYARLDAERRSLVNTWCPPEPERLLRCLADQARRLIRSGEDLLQLLRESLVRFEATLQGETPLHFILWDKYANGRFRPKEEERFTDVLKRHLERDLGEYGVIANREVVIRMKIGEGGTPGEHTDIHIDCVDPGTGREGVRPIRAIVEVKGCWFKGVNERMRTQLRDRYLRDNACRYGLYVVGWFLCNQWDTKDGRHNDAIRLMPATLDQAREKYAAQARLLSENGYVLDAVVINGSLR